MAQFINAYDTTAMNVAVTPGESTTFDLSFVVRDTAELVRFVCTPGGDVTPRSATWLLK